LQESITKYLAALKNLKRGQTPYGLAPHKPVLLLSILQAVQNKLITTNQIFVTPELICLFKSNWNKLVNTGHVCTFALPFFHLHKEKSKIWKIIPKYGFEAIIVSKESISSLTELNNMIEYTKLDDELFACMQNDDSNNLFQYFLLDQYFHDTKGNYIKNSREYLDLFNQIESKLLNEPPQNYATEIKKLIEEKNEEEVFLRGSMFKREIPKIYNNTCCISGMRIESSLNISMIDACHIVPFSESYDDTISNGIALCPNLHRAFDRGLIGIDENYRVIVSDKFIENESGFNIKRFKNKEILLPKSINYYPSISNLEKHRNRFIKNFQ
jgi:putative restriction endonuclease